MRRESLTSDASRFTIFSKAGNNKTTGNPGLPQRLHKILLHKQAAYHPASPVDDKYRPIQLSSTITVRKK